MFEISDDDDEFWEDLPLVSVTSKDNISQTKPPDPVPNKNKNETFNRQTVELCSTALKRSDTSDPGIFSKKIRLDKENIQSDYKYDDKSKNLHINNTFEKGPNGPENVPFGNRKTLPEPEFYHIDSRKHSVEASINDPTYTHVKTSTTDFGISNSWSGGCSTSTNSNSKGTSNSNKTVHINESVTCVTFDKECTGIKAPETPGPYGKDSDHAETSVKKMKRKFPGPAGRLPKLKPGEAMVKTTSTSPESDNKLPQNVIQCSQVTDDVFNESAWQTLLQDLGPEYHLILNQFSVASSLHMASKKTLPKGKIPLLFVIVESIDLLGAGGSVVLKDRTGKIKGTLHRDVIKEYGGDIQAGTTLVLRQVGVVSPTVRTHYLNITPTNMVYLNSNNTNINKHLFHHKSLKHFMADIKRQRKEFLVTDTMLNNSSINQTPCRSNSARFSDNQRAITQNLKTTPLNSNCLTLNSRLNQPVSSRINNNTCLSNQAKRSPENISVAGTLSGISPLNSCAGIQNTLKETRANETDIMDLHELSSGNLNSNLCLNKNTSFNIASRTSMDSRTSIDSRTCIDSRTSIDSKTSNNNNSDVKSGYNHTISNSGRIIPQFGVRRNSSSAVVSNTDNTTVNAAMQATNNTSSNNISLNNYSASQTNNQLSTPKTSKFSFKSKTPKMSPDLGISQMVRSDSLTGDGQPKGTSISKLTTDSTDIWQDDHDDDLMNEMLSIMEEDMS